jgi:hypothetical protein
MGLTLQLLPLLDAVASDGGIESPVWMLGSQQFPNDDAFMATWAAEQGYPTMASAPTVASLFRDRYGAEYVDFDLNEEAAVRLDLTAPLDAARVGGAGAVIDLGTLEHVFDVRAAMETAHAMVRPGGTFVTVAPITWWEHGFFNFNPKFFRAFASANGYEVVTEGYLVRVQLPRLKAWQRTMITRVDGAERKRAKLWLDRMMNRLQPAQLLYCGSFRKARAGEFVVPIDVFGNW